MNSSYRAPWGLPDFEVLGGTLTLFMLPATGSYVLVALGRQSLTMVRAAAICASNQGLD